MANFAHQRDFRARRPSSFSAQRRAGDRGGKITLNVDGYANSGILARERDYLRHER
jgi:hypothetical protein